MMLGVSSKYLANVDSASIQLNCLVLENVLDTSADLSSRVSKHYINQVSRNHQGVQTVIQLSNLSFFLLSSFLKSILQVYKILGSMDFIGSPVNLVSNLGTGLMDFFYEPAKGIVKSPKDFGLGIAKGNKAIIQYLITHPCSPNTILFSTFSLKRNRKSSKEYALRDIQHSQQNNWKYR